MWWWWWWWWSDDGENGDGDYLCWHCMLASTREKSPQDPQVTRVAWVWHSLTLAFARVFPKAEKGFRLCIWPQRFRKSKMFHCFILCGNQASLSQSGNMSQYDQCEIVWIRVNNSRENGCLQFPASGRTDFSNVKNPQTQSCRVFNQIVYEYSMQPLSTSKRSQKDWMRGWQVVAFFSCANMCHNCVSHPPLSTHHETGCLAGLLIPKAPHIECNCSKPGKRLKNMVLKSSHTSDMSDMKKNCGRLWKIMEVANRNMMNILWIWMPASAEKT